MSAALDDIDVLINLASLGFGHGPSIIAACEGAGVKRGVFVSTTSIFTRLATSTKATRLAAEEVIKNSSLDYTIIRPTMIYGTREDRNICRLIQFVRKYPAIPIFGSGKALQQPVYVGDVARAVLDVVGVETTHGRAFNIAGRSPIEYDDLIDVIAKATGSTIRKVHLPVWLGLALASGATKLRRSPVTREQILRLQEDKAFSISEAEEAFGYSPLAFQEGVLRQISEY